ncbi:hypothetical protein [Streptomyces sp. CB01881]|uniref:hypothetical protein n=1 Tax=Streptomyces sp. CB01881 TaxID=2078691 RepID=UPI000CDC9220|nr:hypothetical protein [Streptomyces sp. CB01881]AUY52352.1 hypothetical protein C2142_29355 [Streptomyces sp. CB01881]TYC71775.1 hypothetical protein EH183_29335 [Streptomyces sp. CB01881]
MTIGWDRWVMWGALGGSAALAGAAVAGRVNARSGGLLVLREWLDDPLLFGTSALVLLFVALVLGRSHGWFRSALGAVVLTLIVGSVPLWLLAGVFSDDPRTTRTEAAPGRPDRRLVVKEGTAGFGPDPYSYVYVDDGSGLGVRRWQVADIDRHGIKELAWDGPDQLRLVTGLGRTHLIRIAADGRPSPTVDE